MLNKPIHILGLCGSIRAGSTNLTLLTTAQEVCPEDVEIHLAEIDKFPFYNEDLESDFPTIMRDFKDHIERADAILIATPEYNYSISGVLKNAIEWGSRPWGENSFANKPLGIMSASASIFGGIRAQHHLRQIAVDLQMHALINPTVAVPQAQDKIVDGKLTNKHTREKITELVTALRDWTVRLNLPSATTA